MQLALILACLLFPAVAFAEVPDVIPARTVSDNVSRRGPDKYETHVAELITEFRHHPSSVRLPKLHRELALAYFELGQAHYYRPDLVDRMLYHANALRVKPCAEIDRNWLDRFIEGAVAVKAQFGGKGKVYDQIYGDQKEYEIPEDGVSVVERKTAVEAAEAYVDAKTLKTEAGQLSVEVLCQQMKKRQQSIRSIHYRRKSLGPDKRFMELTLRADGSYKWVNEKGSQEGVRGATDSAISENELFRALGLLDFCGYTNYSLSLQKLQQPPSYLAKLFGGVSVPTLYLVTALSREKNVQTPKVEWIVDGNRMVVVNERQFWQPVLLSGSKEDLAQEFVVDVLQGRESDVYIKRDTYFGRARELSGTQYTSEIEILR